MRDGIRIDQRDTPLSKEFGDRALAAADAAGQADQESSWRGRTFLFADRRDSPWQQRRDGLTQSFRLRFRAMDFKCVERWPPLALAHSGRFDTLGAQGFQTRAGGFLGAVGSQRDRQLVGTGWPARRRNPRNSRAAAIRPFSCLTSSLLASGGTKTQ
jgi:hypothetical protein